MKLFRCTAILVFVLAAPALFAQGADVVLWASWADLGAQDFPDPDFDLELEFESSVGFGASANWFWGDHFSTELFALVLDTEAEFNIGVPGGPVEEAELGSLDLTPIMFTAQYHFSPDSTLDPYLGVGAAYVITGEIEGEGVDPDLGPIDVDDEFTYLVNLGLGIAITPSFGINLDARYLPLEPSSAPELDPTDQVDLELNPLIISAGLRWRFGS